MHWTHFVLYVTGITGVILNNHKRKECFYLWMIGNAGWAFVDYQAGLYVQCLLFVTYFALAVHGIWNWKRMEK